MYGSPFLPYDLFTMLGVTRRVFSDQAHIALVVGPGVRDERTANNIRSTKANLAQVDKQLRTVYVCREAFEWKTQRCAHWKQGRGGTGRSQPREKEEKAVKRGEGRNNAANGRTSAGNTTRYSVASCDALGLFNPHRLNTGLRPADASIATPPSPPSSFPGSLFLHSARHRVETSI